MIVPRPCPSSIVAFVAFVRFTKKVSFGSSIMSPSTWTLIVCVVSPGANARVPSSGR
jgi:hypothetical protein